MSLTALVEVSPRDREVLQGWLRSPSIRAGSAQRARIVLLAGDGFGTGQIASQVGSSKQTVIIWKQRAPVWAGRPAQAGPAAGDRRGADRGRDAGGSPGPARVTHWSSRLLGAELGLSHVTIVKVRKKWNLQPWRSETFKFSTDP